MAIQTGDNKWSPANWIVDPVAGKGDFTTISDACTALDGTGGTIVLKDNNYIEDFTLPAGINITTWGGAHWPANVNISGKITMTEAGTSSIFGCRLSTNNDFVAVVSGSNVCNLVLEDCEVIVSNNTALSFTNTTSSTLLCSKTRFIITDASSAIFESSSPGAITFNFCDTFNAVSSTASTASAGTVSIRNSIFKNVITASSTASINASNTSFPYISDSMYLTLGGSGAQNIINCSIFSGTASAISVGGTAIVAQNFISSTNTNAITGSGTVRLGENTFASSSTVNTSVVTPLPMRGGYTRLTNLGIGVTPSTTAGITFDATSYLNNYVDKTSFTPTLAFGGASVGITYSVRIGSYTRVGNIVFYKVQFNLTSKGSSTGAATLTGFPITAAAIAQYDTTIPFVGNITLTGQPEMSVGSASTTGTFRQQTTGTMAALTDTNFTDTTIMAFQGFYFV